MSASLAASPQMAGAIPRDARMVVEITPEGRSAAPLFRRWAPWCRFLTVPAAAALPADAEPADCVTLDAGCGMDDLRRAAALLRPGGVLLAVAPPPAPAELERLGRLFAAAGLTLEGGEAVRHDGAVVASVVRAVPHGQPLHRLLIQNYALQPVGGCTDVRMLQPIDFLRTIPGVATIIETEGTRNRPFQGDRVLVVQRRIFGRADIEGLRRTARRGYLIVGEMDDHPSYHPDFALNHNIGFCGVHALQTSTAPLAAELAAFNPEVATFPNQLAELPPERRLDPAAPLTVFFGAFNRDNDWKPWMPALNRVAAARRGALRFVVLHDRGFFEALETEDKVFHATCRYADYLALLSRSDVALLPLADTLFNRCKSDLKFIECAASQVVVLASPVVYRDSLADGETGLLIPGGDALERALARLIERPGERIAIANRARAWVGEHRMMARHFRRRYEWYRSLLARRHQLDGALSDRLAAIEGSTA